MTDKYKILFILGSLEVSKCGVCDYTCMLAEKLADQGHTCVCIALNDEFLDSNNHSYYESTHPDIYKMYRFSSSIPWDVRAVKLRTLINEFNPRFISLQFVPYAYNSKGLPYQLFNTLWKIRNRYDIQIMAHELWYEPNKGVIKRCISLCQRFIVLNLFRFLNPKIIHVSNNYYRDILADYGIESNVLPLFSTIVPVVTDVKRKKNHHTWKFIYFGNISQDWEYQQLLNRIMIACRIHKIHQCSFYLIGRCSNYGIALWDKLDSDSKSMYPNFKFVNKGQLPSNEVSMYLSSADFGISGTPSHLLEKSSAVAAMLSHNLPVIVNRFSSIKNYCHDYLKKQGQFIFMDDHFESSLGSFAYNEFSIDQLSYVAKKLVSDMI